MNHKELAQTGLHLPEIGIGTWKFKGGTEPIRKAIECGASFIDTAELYGNEQLVGQALQGIRDQVFLATKISPQHFSRADVFQSADKSLQLLGTDRIDLYQLHRPSYTVPIEETMGAMEELVEAGKVHFIGVSNFAVPELKQAMAAMRKHKIVSNQVLYNLMDRSVEVELLPFCRANHIAVIAYSPLGNGLPKMEARDPKGVLGQIAQQTGKTKAQIALNWCISKEQVIAIPKASSTARVEENCQASGWKLSPEQIRILETQIQFRRRSALEAALRRMARRILRAVGRG